MTVTCMELFYMNCYFSNIFNTFIISYCNYSRLSFDPFKPNGSILYLVGQFFDEVSLTIPFLFQREVVMHYFSYVTNKETIDYFDDFCRKRKL